MRHLRRFYLQFHFIKTRKNFINCAEIRKKVNDHDETRTLNLLIRSHTPYTLGHAAIHTVLAVTVYVQIERNLLITIMSDLSGSLLHRIGNIFRSHMIFNSKQIPDDSNFEHSYHMSKSISLCFDFFRSLCETIKFI